MSGHRKPQYNLRLPKELKDFLADQAQKDGRSLNNYIVKSLEDLRMNISKKTD